MVGRARRWARVPPWPARARPRPIAEFMTSRRPLLKIALSALALVALLATSANAELARQKRAAAHASAFRAAKVNIPVRDPAPPPGAQVLKYKFGPMRIQPGQNLINIDLQKERPDVDGYIVGFRPGLVYAGNGKSPSVKIVHLHHAVWLRRAAPLAP